MKKPSLQWNELTKDYIGDSLRIDYTDRFCTPAPL